MHMDRSRLALRLFPPYAPFERASAFNAAVLCLGTPLGPERPSGSKAKDLEIIRKNATNTSLWDGAPISLSSLLRVALLHDPSRKMTPVHGDAMQGVHLMAKTNTVRAWRGIWEHEMAIPTCARQASELLEC